MAVTKRSTKGSALSHAEMDANWDELIKFVLTFLIVNDTTEKMRLVSGNLLIGLTSPVTNGGCLQLKSGISFPATAVPSADVNTLDDYEEGTFTPTVVGSTAAGTGTYTTQIGRYTRIGNRVFLHIDLSWSAHDGTGSLRIAGLPFTVNSNSTSALAVYSDGLVVGAGKQLQAIAIGGATQIYIRAMDTAGGAMVSVDMDSSVTQLRLGGHYEVA